LRDGNLPVNYW